MAKPLAARTPGRQLPDLPLAPAASALTPQLVERRDVTRRDALSRRVLSEFTEMPGLVLTLPQASRLFGIGGDACARILSHHIRQGRLRLTNDSLYTLASDGKIG